MIPKTGISTERRDCRENEEVRDPKTTLSDD